MISTIVDAQPLPLLQQTLAKLYLGSGKYDNALQIYLQMQRSEAFDVIQNHNLFHRVAGKVRCEPHILCY